MTQEMLSDPPDPLAVVARLARRVADADVATIVVPAGPDSDLLCTAARDGMTDAVAELPFASSGSVEGVVIDTGESLVLNGGAGGIGHAGAEALPQGPTLVVPLTGGRRKPLGALTLIRGEGKPAFRTDERAMAVGFAQQAALAMHLHEAQVDRQAYERLQVGEKIAETLQDTVIRDLFGTGLTLQNLAARITDREASDVLADTVARLDELIGKIRRSIFGGEAPPEHADWRKAVMDVAAAFVDDRGRQPALAFTGGLEGVSDEAVHQAASEVHRVLTAVTRQPAVSPPCVTLDSRDGSLHLRVEADLPPGELDSDVEADLLAVTTELREGDVSSTGSRLSVRWTTPV
jgi:hypothetical protein